MLTYGMGNQEPRQAITEEDLRNAEFEEGSDQRAIFHPPDQRIVSREQVYEMTGDYWSGGLYKLPSGEVICVL